MEPGTGGEGARDAAPSGMSSKWKRRFMGTGVAAALLAGAYVTGRVQTHSAIGVAEEQTKQAQTSAQSSEQLTLRLEARRHLDLALRQIDRRNFGTAADELGAAAGLLAKSKPDGDLGKLAQDLSGYHLVATDDVSKQREQVLAFSDRFDALVPPAKP